MANIGGKTKYGLYLVLLFDSGEEDVDAKSY